MPQLILYRPDHGVSELSAVEEAQAALQVEGNVLWVDLSRRSPSTDKMLSELFGFHPLAIEDVYKDGHRPKVEDYDQYLYIIAQGLRQASGWDLEMVELTELDLFVGKRFLVTHHQQPLVAVEATKKRVHESNELIAKGPIFLAHAVLDKLTDQFVPLADAFEEEVERLEEEILKEKKGRAQLERILGLTHSLQRLRRMTVQQRDVLGRLAKAEFDEIPDEARPFFRDVHEHSSQFLEAVEGERDELAALFNAFHSLASHRMNEVMRVLTVISTIVLPLTFLTGVYGMNFRYMPELNWAGGYLAFWGVTLVIVLSTTLYFRRRDWL